MNEQSPVADDRSGIHVVDEHSHDDLEEPLMIDHQRHPAMQCIPHGCWRKDMYELMSLLGTPAFFSAIICGPLLLRQIFVRGNFDVGVRTCLLVLPVIVVVCGVLVLVFSKLAVVYPQYDPTPFSALAITFAVVLLCAKALFIYWSFQARARMRAKYSIPGNPADDCVASCLCNPCSLLQMASHTADLDMYRSYYCTPTGLATHHHVRVV